MKPFIYPYKMSSKGAIVLAEALNTSMVYPNRNFRNLPNQFVVNWGNGDRPETWVWTERDLNDPEIVSRTIHKLYQYAALRGHGLFCPTLLQKEHAQELVNQGIRILGRDRDTGKGGIGIHIYDNENNIVNRHIFYTTYWKKKREFRVHVFKDRVIEIQEKKKSSDGVDNQYIRSHKLGWIFCKNDLEPIPELVYTTSINAVRALSLDFGGVDIGFNRRGEVCVFEVNSAPGIEGTTVEKFVQAIRDYGRTL